MDDSRPSGELVVCARRPTVFEAQLAANMLAAEGLAAQVEPSCAYDMMWHLQPILNPGGVAILVPESQLELAQSLLESRRAEFHAADQEAVKEEAEQAREGTQEEPQGQTQLEAAGRHVRNVALLWLFLLWPPVAFFSIVPAWRRFAAARANLSPESQEHVRHYLVQAAAIAGLGTALWLLPFCYVVVRILGG